MLDLQLPARHDWAVHERATASWSWSLSSSGSPSRFGDGLAAGIAERQVALSTARVLTSQRLDEHPLALVVSNAVACLRKSARHRNQEDGDQRRTDENREAEEFGRLEARFQVELRRLRIPAIVIAQSGGS